jgi:hypothetical protein
MQWAALERTTATLSASSGSETEQKPEVVARPHVLSDVAPHYPTSHPTKKNWDEINRESKKVCARLQPPPPLLLNPPMPYVYVRAHTHTHTDGRG